MAVPLLGKLFADKDEAARRRPMLERQSRGRGETRALNGAKICRSAKRRCAWSLDHLIVVKGGYASLKDMGVLEQPVSHGDMALRGPRARVRGCGMRGNGLATIGLLTAACIRVNGQEGVGSSQHVIPVQLQGVKAVSSIVHVESVLGTGDPDLETALRRLIDEELSRAGITPSSRDRQFLSLDVTKVSPPSCPALGERVLLVSLQYMEPVKLLRDPQLALPEPVVTWSEKRVLCVDLKDSRRTVMATAKDLLGLFTGYVRIQR